MPAKRGHGRKVVLLRILEEMLGPNHGISVKYDTLGALNISRSANVYKEWVLDFAAWRKVMPKRYRVRTRAMTQPWQRTYFRHHKDHVTLEAACYDVARRIIAAGTGAAHGPR